MSSSGRNKGGKGLGKGGGRKAVPTFSAGVQAPHQRKDHRNLGLPAGMTATGLALGVLKDDAKKLAHTPSVQSAASDITASLRRSRRQQALDPENEGLSRPDRTGGGGLLSGRAKPSTTSAMDTTQDNKSVMTPLLANKSFKEGTYRVHVKGARDKAGTSGIRPYFTQSGTRAWTEEHETVRNALGARLMADKGFTPLNSGTSSWGAENSHMARKAMHGPDDVLNAPPASVHQNTEMLGIETGVEHLEKQWGDRLRVKITGYIHDEKQGTLAGTLKAFRYKIHLQDDQGEWNKVFDHIGSGLRGNIDQNEARGWRDQVKALTPDSKPLRSLKQAPSGGFLPGKGVQGAAPSESAIRKGSSSSALSPMVTDMRHGSTIFNRSQALSKMQNIVKARAKQITGS